MKAKKIIKGLLILIFVLVTSIFFPAIRSLYNQETNKDFVENIENNVISGNIKLVQLNHETGFNSSSIAVSAGGSGVVFRLEFPEIKVEYTSEKYDLALISFESDKVYTVLSVAANSPRYGDTVAAMSNPYGKRNIVTVGHIGFKKIWSFEDDSGKVQYPIIKHSAAMSGGSSGSALLNEDLEIVGINLGGNENILHRFISGMAMPVDQIRLFLAAGEK